MSKKLSYIFLLAVGIQLSLNAQVRILTIGDSTMADYDENINSGEKEQRGWAQMLPFFLKEGVELDNAARNGRSSKSFYLEYWEDLRETLKKDDYVIIQFGHNDEKNNGADTDENNIKERGTAPWGQYQRYLRKYITESREKGANPILATPVARRMFDGNVLAPKGRHSLTEHSGGNDSILNYSLAMKSVAREMNVPLIDMTTLSQKLVENFGSDKSAEIIYVETDKTHLKAMGAVLFSSLFVEDMMKQNILTDYFRHPSPILLSPDNYDFGDQPIGYSTVRTASLMGFNLDSSIENLELSVAPPFEIAQNRDGIFTNKMMIKFDQITTKIDHNIFTEHLYIRFTPLSSKKHNIPLFIYAKGLETACLSLEGKGIVLKKNTILALKCDPSKEKGIQSKYKTSLNLEGLTFKEREGEKVITTLSNTWDEQEIDMDARRYIEFSVKPDDEDIYISEISFDLGSIGGEHMYFTALGSRDRWFKQQETFAIMEKAHTHSPKNYVFKTMIKVPEKETFYLRIYPWYKSDKKTESKFLVLENVEIKAIKSKQ